MIIKIETKIKLNIEDCKLKNLVKVFLQVLSSVFEKVVSQALMHYYYKYLEDGTLNKMLNTNERIYQKSHSKETKFKTIFGTIKVPQIQVKIGKRQESITRKLLGVESRLQIPIFMKELLAHIGALTTYRVGEKIIKMISNFQISLMSIWRSVQIVASKLTLKEVKNGTNEYQADGTGIPTRGSGKRGSELKVVYQTDTNGKLHLVGIAVGKYKEIKNWLSALSSSLTAGIAKFGKVFLASDCDSSIINTAKSLGKEIHIQMDLWHVFHQMKYYLWQDKVEKTIKYNIILLVYKIALVKINFSVEKRLRLLKIIINSLITNNYTHTANYLTSCLEYFYTFEKHGNTNKYTSKTERSMRTINARINVGVWSDAGAENVSKIRLAHYYNGERASIN